MTGRVFWVASLLVTALLGPGAARAQDDGVTYGDDWEIQRHRSLQVAAGAAYLSTFPGAMADGGPMALGSLTFLRRGGRHLELSLDAALGLAFGVETSSLHLTLGPRAGAALFFGWIGFEMKMGLSALFQLGPRSAGGFGFWAEGGYVFRFGEAYRQRLKLLLSVRPAFYLAADPGNDLGMNAMAMALLLAYEWPLSSGSK